MHDKLPRYMSYIRGRTISYRRVGQQIVQAYITHRGRAISQGGWTTNCPGIPHTLGQEPFHTLLKVGQDKIDQTFFMSILKMAKSKEDFISWPKQITYLEISRKKLFLQFSTVEGTNLIIEPKCNGPQCNKLWIQL